MVRLRLIGIMMAIVPYLTSDIFNTSSADELNLAITVPKLSL